MCTINNKIRSFNYIFFMRNVPYEKRLHHMKIKPTPMCNTCGDIETLLHLYWSCPMANRLWERLKVLVRATQNIKLTRTPEKCLLGIGTNIYWNHTNMLLNILFLLTKSYIHKKKCLNEYMNFKGLFKYIKSIYQTETQIG